MYPAPQCGHLKPMSCPNWPPIVALYAIRWLQRRRRTLLRPSQRPPASAQASSVNLKAPLRRCLSDDLLDCASHWHGYFYLVEATLVLFLSVAAAAFVALLALLVCCT